MRYDPSMSLHDDWQTAGEFFYKIVWSFQFFFVFMIRFREILNIIRIIPITVFMRIISSIFAKKYFESILILWFMRNIFVFGSILTMDKEGGYLRVLRVFFHACSKTVNYRFLQEKVFSTWYEGWNIHKLIPKQQNLHSVPQ